jgi:hypothetical protein
MHDVRYVRILPLGFRVVFFFVFLGKLCCRKKSNFEWILLLEIQTNCQNCILEGKIS